MDDWRAHWLAPRLCSFPPRQRTCLRARRGGLLEVDVGDDSISVSSPSAALSSEFSTDETNSPPPRRELLETTRVSVSPTINHVKLCKGVF